jgi:hypothetical protein
MLSWPVIQRELVTDPTGEPWAVITYKSRPSLSWFAALVRLCRVAVVPFRATPAFLLLEIRCRQRDARAQSARLTEQVERRDFVW